MGDSETYINSTAAPTAEGGVLQNRNRKTVIRIQGK